MRRQKTQPIGAVIKEYLKAIGIDQRLKEHSLVKSWEESVGKTIALSTTNIYIKNRILYIKFDSSIIKHEILMLKTPLIAKLNQPFGEQIIADIVVF